MSIGETGGNGRLGFDAFLRLAWDGMGWDGYITIATGIWDLGS